MEQLRRVHGPAVALVRDNVDTDQIIPASWLKRVERTGFEQGLFSQWRKDPDFVLNNPAAVGARVLVAGANFGCGSSREHAVWALQQHGFQAVIAPSFADIFRNNCASCGLVAAEVAPETAQALLGAISAQPGIEVTVDVDSRRVQVAALDIDEPFALNDFSRWRLLEGLDDIGLTLREDTGISAYEKQRPGWLPRSRPHTEPVS